VLPPEAFTGAIGLNAVAVAMLGHGHMQRRALLPEPMSRRAD
jgi:hypothetical protein